MTIEIPVLFASWTFWLFVGTVVVIIAAALLLTILLAARAIRSDAVRALEAVRRIDESTAPVWRLQDVLHGLMRVRKCAGSIAEKAELLAGTVHGERGGSARVGGGGEGP